MADCYVAGLGWSSAGIPTMEALRVCSYLRFDFVLIVRGDAQKFENK